MSTDLHESDELLPLAETESEEAADAFFDSVIGHNIGNYQIEKRLGAGAMAAIYRAVDTTSNQPVALKLLTATADDVLRARFEMEARTVRNLHHPNIVEVFDTGKTEQGIPYIAMRLVDGEDLGSFLERRYQLSILDSCQILQPIAAALAYAHEAGIVHRDVKPGNILLCHVPQGTPASIQLSDMDVAVIPLLSDFGIARALDAPELTTLGRTIGTPAYMSPEQCAGNRQLDGRADIYSLGTVLYRCLVGRAPFVGATTQILHAHVYESILIPDNLASALPPAMKVILQKTLQKEPDARYANAEQLAGDLARMIQEIMPSNATLTMPSLPVTPLPAGQSTQVLVAGLGEQPSDATPYRTFPALQGRSATSTGARLSGTKSPRVNPSRRQAPRPTNWAAILLGILLSAGIGLVLFSFFITISPRLTSLSSLLNFAPTADSTGRVDDSVSPSLVANLPPDTATAIPALTTVISVTMPNSGALTSTLTSTFASTVTSTLTNSFSSATVAPPLPSPNSPVSATVTAVQTTVPGARHTATAIETATVPVAMPSMTTTISAQDQIDVAATWEDVKYYYDRGEWGQARWRLITMLSAAENLPEIALNNSSPALQSKQIYEGLIENPRARFWRQWIGSFTAGEVSLVLADIYMGLANEDIASTADLTQLSDQAADYLIAAATGRPNNDVVRQLSAAINSYLLATKEQQQVLVDGLASAYLAYADERYKDGAHCVAAQALEAAQQLVDEQIPADLLRRYAADCGNVVIAQSPSPVANPLSGTIYYSSEASGRYTIWRVSLSNLSAPGLVINNASQPSLDGNHLAFYSRRSDSEGLSGVDLNRAINPDEKFPRYTNAVEDARESPAQWNPSGTTLVFSSTDGGDNKPRLYLAPAAFGSTKDVIALGEDPVWSPDGNAIVYRDTGIDGNSPGLARRSLIDGSYERLTYGEDRRPVWTSDGKYIIFMRNVGGTNSELFRLTVADNTLVQLTNDPAQDGLPAINPADNTIVFASDRNGVWNLWTISLFESEVDYGEPNVYNVRRGQATFLTSVQGAFLLWLEHSIQWVN